MKKSMGYLKYILIPYVALGLVLSLVIGIEYNCLGDGASPIYYGSPFVFKEKSLVSSMQYYYSISGVLLNVAVWSSFIFILRFVLLRLLGKSRIIKNVCRLVIGILIAFTSFCIAIEAVLLGDVIKDERIYWRIDMNNEAVKWGMTCEGKVLFL